MKNHKPVISHISEGKLFRNGGENGQLISDFSVRFNSLQITKHKIAEDKMDLSGNQSSAFLFQFCHCANKLLSFHPSLCQGENKDEKICMIYHEKRNYIAD